MRSVKSVLEWISLGEYGAHLYHCERPAYRIVVFLAAGTGVAPFKSMIDHLFETGRDQYEGRPRDIWLFLGAAWRDTLPYQEFFESYADQWDNFHFVPTVSRESYLTNWDGETAYVQYTLTKYLDDDALSSQTLPEGFEQYRNERPRYSIDARLNPSQVGVYACGLNAMVYSLVRAVEQLGVAPEHTQFEGFG